MKKKRFIFCCALVICCIFGGAANAKNVYYETFNDGKTGRQIEYFDLYEDTTRNYFTQNAWFSDNKSFIVCGESDGTIGDYFNITPYYVSNLFKKSEKVGMLDYISKIRI